MKYLIPFIILFTISCNDSKNTQHFFEMDKNIETKKSNSKHDMIVKIQIALKERGYDLEVNGIMDVETKKAIMKFQEDNDIPWQYPVGPLETIRALGIEY